MNIDELEHETIMGSNLSRRRNRQHFEADHRSPTLTQRNDETLLHVSPSSDISTSAPEDIPPLISEDESITDSVDQSSSTDSASTLSSGSQGIGMILSSGDFNRSDNLQPTLRLSIIYFVPHRRGRRSGEAETSGSNNSLEEMLNGDAPFNPNMLGRVLFAMTIPIGGTGGNPFQLHSFEDLLDHLMRQHVARGPPPTSKLVLEKLPVLPVTNLLLEERCLVCQENFALEETALRLPCDHHFHKDCVMSWLESHCTCPTCRYELPVDDQEYEAERKKRMAARGINEESVAEETEPMDIQEDKQEEKEDEEDFNEVPYESISYNDMTFEGSNETQEDLEDIEDDEIFPPEKKPLLSSPRYNDHIHNKYNSTQHIVTDDDGGHESVHAS